MKTVELSDEVVDRIQAFADVYRAVVDDDADFIACVEVLLDRGFDAAIADVLQDQEHETLVKSFQQLASKSPREVCRFIAETLDRGAAVSAANRPNPIGFSSE